MEIESAAELCSMENLSGKDPEAGGTEEMEIDLESSEDIRKRDSLALIQPAIQDPEAGGTEEMEIDLESSEEIRKRDSLALIQPAIQDPEAGGTEEMEIDLESSEEIRKRDSLALIQPAIQNQHTEYKGIETHNLPFELFTVQKRIKLRYTKPFKQETENIPSNLYCTEGILNKIDKKGKTLGGQSKIILHNNHGGQEACCLLNSTCESGSCECPLGKCVGCIVSKQNGNIEAIGTGFLLNRRLGLTCYHVVRSVSDPSCLAITFAYNKKDQCIQQMPVSFPIKIIHSNEREDFVFFKIPLDPKSPEGLLEYVGAPPDNGHVSIIGHPGGQYRQDDKYCSVIALYDRVDKIKYEAANNPKFINILSKFNFLNMANPRLLTYNTCFYFGSSGSPVFNDCGKLVAMHQGGYAVKTCNGTESPIEFGMNIVYIVINGALKIEDLCQQLKNIVKQNKSLYKYIRYGKHPSYMQPIIRQLLQLWGYNDSGIDSDSDMDTS